MQEVFAVCIISRVTTIKQDLLENMMLNEDLVSNPFWLLEKLRTLAVHEQTNMKYNSKSNQSSSTTSALSTTSNRKGKRSQPSSTSYQHPCENGHDPKTTHSQRNCWYNNPSKRPKRFDTNFSSQATLTQASSNNNQQQSSANNNENNENAVPTFGYCSTVLSSVSQNNFSTVLDSGASNHMFNSLDFFVETEPVHIFIVTGDGKAREELIAVKKGTTMIQLASHKIITLKDSLYVPNLTQNLISFSQLIDKQILIQQCDNIYKVILNNQEKLFNINLVNQLFEIDGDVLPIHNA
jgi:hypothetical protein